MVAILGCMGDVLKENGFRTELVNPESETQPIILRIEAQKVGKIMQDVLFEMCFIPMQLPNENTGLLQTYVTMFTGLLADNAKETKKAVAHCNDYCPLGAFGYFEPAGQLYLKHNTLLNTAGELEDVITFMCDNVSLILASVTKFIDAFAAVSNGVMTVDVAIEQELLPQM